MEQKDIGKLFIDAKGAGRLYIPKSFMEKLPFENHEKVKLIFDPETRTLRIEEL